MKPGSELRSKVLARIIALCVALLGVAAGCDGVGTTDAGARDAAPVVPTIEIGTGDEQFEPIVNGQDLLFIRGPQGGLHFLASVRVTGIITGNPDDRRDPQNPTTEFRAYVGDTRIDLMASTYTQGLDPVAGGAGFEMVGRLLILDIERCEELENMETRVEVNVTDVAGVMLHDERTITAIPHPMNP